MSGKRSKNKGAAGEREAARLLTDCGFPSHRGRQYSGGPNSPDIISEGPFHVEVKRAEQFSPYDALEQSTRDAAEGKLPIVLHRKNNKRWLIIADAEGLLKWIFKLLS